MGSLWEGELGFSREWCHCAHTTTQNSILVLWGAKIQMSQFFVCLIDFEAVSLQSPELDLNSWSSCFWFMSSKTLGVSLDLGPNALLKNLFYVCGCLPTCLYTLHTHAPPEARRGHWSFWSRIYSCECHVADGNQKWGLLTAAPFLHPQPRCFLWMLFICFVLIFKRTCQPSMGNGESSIRLKRLDSLGLQIWGNLGL